MGVEGGDSEEVVDGGGDLEPGAVAFSAANLALLRVRVRIEERALGPSWEREFSGVPRFVPHG